MELTQGQSLAFITLRFSGPRKTAPLSDAALRALADREGIDPERLKANNRLYTGKAFEAIERQERQARARLKDLAIATPNGLHNVYVLPQGIAAQAFSRLEDDKQERNDLIDEFLQTDYDQERERARNELNGEFKEEYFPPANEARQYFKMSWTTFSITTPDGLPPEEAQKLRDNLETVYTECRMALRKALAELVSHLADRLTPGPDGKKKRLATTTVTNLQEFLDTINKRNITSDDDLQRLSDRARNLIGNTDAEALRKGVFVTKKVREGLDAIKQDIDAVIVRDGARKIDLDLE